MSATESRTDSTAEDVLATAPKLSVFHRLARWNEQGANQLPKLLILLCLLMTVGLSLAILTVSFFWRIGSGEPVSGEIPAILLSLTATFLIPNLIILAVSMNSNGWRLISLNPVYNWQAWTAAFVVAAASVITVSVTFHVAIISDLQIEISGIPGAESAQAYPHENRMDTRIQFAHLIAGILMIPGVAGGLLAFSFPDHPQSTEELRRRRPR